MRCYFSLSLVVVLVVVCVPGESDGADTTGGRTVRFQRPGPHAVHAASHTR